LNPDLVGKWSHSPAKALPFLPEAQTNTILILNPSANPLYSSSHNFPNIFTCAKRSQTNLKCPPFSACYFMTHSLTTHFFFCVSVCTLKQNCLHKKKGAPTRPRCTTRVVPFPCQSPAFHYTSLTRPNQSPSFPSTSPDEHHPNPKPFFQTSLFPFPRSPQV